MSQILKAFLGMFFIMVLLFLGMGIVSAQMEVSDALDYKSDIVAELENSNYSPQVINACIRQAIANGYSIEVKTFVPGQSAKTYTQPNASDTTGVVMAEIKLTYSYSIGILNMVTKHQVRGYAR